MVLYGVDATLCIDIDDEDNPRIRNITSSEAPELQQFKLSDFYNSSVSLNLSNITVLQLDHCDISEVPPSVQKMNLKQLVLTHNKLNEIPSCLYSGLRSLELLDLSYNCILDFQIEPACINSIIKLNISNNGMRDFPQWILTMPCPKLQQVCYNKNCLIKFNKQRDLQLRKLEMCNTKLIDIDLLLLRSIKPLEFLDIGNDQSGKNENVFKELNNLFTRFKWKNLKTLKMNNLTIAIVPKGLFSVNSLTELYLSNCDLSWIPEEVQYLKNLQVLDISENGICSLPKYLTYLENLSVIKASHNYISSVGDLHNDLKILDLYHNQLENWTFSLSRTDCIDLEKNFFDTLNLNNFDEYNLKKQKYRNYFKLERGDGPENQQNEDFFEERDYCSEDELIEHSSNSYKYDFINYDYEEECWDEEIAIKETREPNPDITPSDDEWTGKEDIKRKKWKPIGNKHFDENEDWIFTDAEEDL